MSQSSQPPAGADDRIRQAAQHRHAVVGAGGLLAVFNDADVLNPLDVTAASTIARLCGETDEQVILAAALTVRGTRFGHVCIRLESQRGTVAVDGADSDGVEDLPWPDPDEWREVVAASVLVGDGSGDEPMVLDGDRLYLERYFRYEQRFAGLVEERCRRSNRPVDARALEMLARLLPPGDDGAPTRQYEAAVLGLTGSVAVIAGGPGTGKTHTVGAMLAALAAAGPDAFPLTAVCAPTGKAAARLGEALRGLAGDIGDDVAAETLRAVAPSTIHRLLGWTWDRGRFAHDATNRLPHELVIVDEMSMVSLPMAAKLLDAVRDEATIVLVGDPFQLESIEAGTVLADIVGPALERPERPHPSSADAPGRPADTLDSSDRTAAADRIQGTGDPADGTEPLDGSESETLDAGTGADAGGVVDDDGVLVERGEAVIRPEAASADPEGQPGAGAQTDAVQPVDRGSSEPTPPSDQHRRRGDFTDAPPSRHAGSIGAPIARHVVVLDRVHRFAEGGVISAFAEAIRTGNADLAVEMLEGGHDELRWVPDRDSPGFGDLWSTLVDQRLRMVEQSGQPGDAAAALRTLSELAVLCARRRGPDGVARWGSDIEAALDEHFTGLRWDREWYPGRPVMITRNDYPLDLYNGDIGICVETPEGMRAVFDRNGVREVPLSHLGEHTTVHAMTIHKSQGSQFDAVVVVLPGDTSPLVTRELLYTAVTRATTRIHLVADEPIIRNAITRSVERASGLGSRLWRPAGSGSALP